MRGRARTHRVFVGARLEEGGVARQAPHPDVAPRLLAARGARAAARAAAAARHARHAHVRAAARALHERLAARRAVAALRANAHRGSEPADLIRRQRTGNTGHVSFCFLLCARTSWV
jgi:hypothetical protein